MSEQPSATIIAFPRPRAAPPPAMAPDLPDRLQQALAALDQALTEQRHAVARWRESLGELRGSVNELGASLVAYQQRLGSLALGVDGLHQEARRMESWADRAIAGPAEA